jgi:Kef-type K+ transport system membrane component KefB
MTVTELSIAFFLQMFVILAACRLVGWIVTKYFKQPQVIGEMIAGIVLGPSLLGLLWPDVQAALFPPASKPVLFVISQFGIGLFMFIVGMGFRADHFKTNSKAAVAISASGVTAPFLVAIIITPFLIQVPGLFIKGVTTLQATLFLGACIAITAFPVLARILHEKGLSHTKIGTLTLSSAAIDDAGAWCVLALVLASLGDGAGVAIKAVAGGLCFALFMILLGPKLLAPLAKIVEREGQISPTVLSIVLMIFVLSAWAMDYVGMHAVFGGFILGVVMPRGKLTDEVKKTLEPIAVTFLVPIFFTYSGLHTQLNVVNNIELMTIAGGILLVSVLSKAGACYLAARACGQDNRTALSVGTLMNARGLTELIIINIGLQRGIIGPALFSMLVVMAIVTTLMTSPLFDVIQNWGKKKTPLVAATENGPKLD